MKVLGEMAWTEVTGDGAVLAVPVGSTEQHGPHLPLSTDSDIASALTRGLADLLPGVVVAPVVAYGASGEHQSFPGTLSIGAAAVEQLLVELARSATETFSRVLLVSAHGGNVQPVGRAVTRLRREGRDVRAWSPGPSWAGDLHAGRTETSLMLALAPERVRADVASAGNLRPVGELMPAMRRGGVAAVSANGVLGDPDGASAAHGRRLLGTAVVALRDAVRTWPDDERRWL